ncbi:Cof-type HAD-IIB family hydrolase [Streptococcus dentiloxodontae]
MAEIKVVALDLDNTLFNSQKKVSEGNKAVLRRARDKGVKVVITTGRPLKAIEWLIDEIGLRSDEQYIITFNGGMVQRTTGEILDKTTISLDQVREIYKEIAPLGLPLDVLSDAEVYEINQVGRASLYQAVNPLLTFHEVDTPDAIPEDLVINKVIVAFEQEYLDAQIPKISEELHSKFEICKSRDIVLEIMPKGVHKATGLKLLAQHLDLSSENFMTVGDEENDLTMTQWAGLGVAMKNAVPALRDVADAITEKDNDENGVGWAVEKYILSQFDEEN